MSDALEPSYVTSCEVCRTRLSYDPDIPAGWLDVEVKSADGDEWYPDFCSREHASAWFAQPLPQPDRRAPGHEHEYEVHRHGSGAIDYVLTIGGVGILVVLALFGLYSLVKPMFVYAFS